jgi:uncharacterized protein YdbL (DUF1318 family)
VKHFTRLVLAATLIGLAAPAAGQSSLEIAAAKSMGIVGERYDGYLGFAARPSEAVRRQMGAVNIRRRSLYTGLAARRNATVQEVGIAAGCELLAGIRVGEAYMLNDGAWRKRAPGQPAPVPGYCGR